MLEKEKGRLIKTLLYTLLIIALCLLFSFNFLLGKGYFEFLPSDVSDTLATISIVVTSLWWLWATLMLFFLGRNVWLAYRQLIYKTSIPWVMMELRIPREIKKTPRAMEQVLMSIYALRNTAGDMKEKWWDGEVTLWFSCEIVSLGGEIHIYMRVPKARRNVIEASLYAQYTDIEIVDIDEDYVNRMPATTKEIYKMKYNFFGTELRLNKSDEYPIRTYIDFESPAEEKELDPISALLEILAKMSARETIWVQILFKPVGNEWRKRGERKIKELQEKAGRQQTKTEAGTFVWTMPTPGEIEIMKAIDRNISKPGFETLIRYIYFAPKEIYTDTFPRRGLLGAFNQYASESMNKFIHNHKAWTRADIWHWPRLFPKKRLEARRKRMLDSYRRRRMLNETRMTTFLNMRFFDLGFAAQKIGKMILNVEELATVFHMPTYLVMTAHLIKRIDSRKIGPPAGLPIYGEGEEKELPGA